MTNMDYDALDVWLKRSNPIQQMIATVVSASGGRAYIKPLGAGVPLEARIAPDTHVSSGDEVYAIRSKWQPNWIILTNLGREGAHSNSQNTVPVHTQGVSRAGNTTHKNIDPAAAFINLVVGSNVELGNATHNAKTETILVTGTAYFNYTTGTNPIFGMTVLVDGVDFFPVDAPWECIIPSDWPGISFAIPVKGIKPGTRTIAIAGQLSTGSGQARIMNINIVDL